MKVSDYVATFLKTKVSHVFGLQGGAVVHLFDSCARLGPRPVYCHHEQAAGLAAVSYSRIKGYGAAIVTTGPGAFNALTALLAAWQDSIPCLFISGQTRAEHTSYGKPDRQIGTQEAPIVDVVTPMAKWANWCRTPADVQPMLDAAYFASVEGRPGPSWIDIPVDVSWREM